MPVLLHDTRSLPEKLTTRVERKFYLPPGKVEMAYGLLRALTRPDPEFPVEEISSLYFDSVDLDELESSLSGDYRKNKVRIRWYGGRNNGVTSVFIELKARQGFASTKQRRKLEVPSKKLLPRHLASGIVPPGQLAETLSGFGFFTRKALLPVIKISYLRFRFRDAMGSQSLAIDCHIRATPVMRQLENTRGEIEVTGAVLEIKGPGMELPVFLNRVNLLEVDWTQFSKYSACVSACRDREVILGRASPPGLCVPEMPVVLREPVMRDSDWGKLFPGANDNSFLRKV